MPRPASTPLSSKELSNALRCTVTPWEPNWSDEDSLKLVEAYKNVMAENCSMLYIMTYVCLGTETQTLLNKRIWEKFLEGAPTYLAKSEKSVIQHWMQMVTSYRFICNYTFTRINNLS